MTKAGVLTRHSWGAIRTGRSRGGGRGGMHHLEAKHWARGTTTLTPRYMYRIASHRIASPHLWRRYTRCRAWGLDMRYACCASASAQGQAAPRTPCSRKTNKIKKRERPRHATRQTGEGQGRGTSQLILGVCVERFVNGPTMRDASTSLRQRCLWNSGVVQGEHREPKTNAVSLRRPQRRTCC